MATRVKTREISAVEGGDARIEAVLEKRGIDFVFHPTVGPAAFDVDRSLHNNVRFEAVDEKKVEEYAEAMKRGDVFPPVIAQQTKNGFLLVDGNHRLHGAIKAKGTLGVYELVNASGESVALVAAEINARHGKATSEEERIQQGLFLIEQGATLATAADAVSLPRRILDKASTRRSTDARFAEAGIAALVIEKLAESVKWRLAMVTTDAGFKAAVELASAANLSTDQVFDLVTRVNHLRDSDKQVAFIADMRTDMLGAVQESGGGVFVAKRGGLGPRAKVGLAVTNVLSLNFDNLEEVSRLWIGAEREDVAKRMADAAKRLNALARALKA